MDVVPVYLENIDIDPTIKNYKVLARTLLKFQPNDKDYITFRTECAEYIDSISIFNIVGDETFERKIYQKWHEKIDPTFRRNVIQQLVSIICFGYSFDVVRKNIETIKGHVPIFIKFAIELETYIYMKSSSYEMYHNQLKKDSESIFIHLLSFNKLPRIKPLEESELSAEIIVNTSKSDSIGRIEDDSDFNNKPNMKVEEAVYTTRHCVIS